MSTKIWDVFVRRQSSGANIAPETFEVDDGGEMKTVMTMADSVRPLLTSMKLFGLYVGSRTKADDDEKSRRRWKWYLIYSLFVVILLWINVVRLFSMFKTYHS